MRPKNEIRGQNPGLQSRKKGNDRRGSGETAVSQGLARGISKVEPFLARLLLYYRRQKSAAKQGPASPGEGQRISLLETRTFGIKNSPFRNRLSVAALAGLLALAATILPAAGQGESSGKPIIIQASAFAESEAVRDLPPASVSGKGEPEEKEINPENRELIRHVDPKVKPSADAVLSSSLPRKKRRLGVTVPQALPTPTVSFDGISSADTGSIGQNYLPPDTNGAAGPNHYVQVVNVAFRVWNKSGSPLTNVAALASLFSPLGSPCGSEDDGDPIVIYDQLADRWIISEFCVDVTVPNHQLIAVSKTGDPTGAYYLYDFVMPNDKFNDYPKFGVWPDAYYMTDNQFNQAGTTFLQSGVFAFDRAKMLAGDPTAGYVYFDTATLFPPSTGNTGPDGIGGLLPACLDGLMPPAIGTPCPFAYFQAGEFGDPGDRLRIFDFHVDFSAPANSTFTERTGSPLTVAAFDPVTVPNSRNVIPQPAPSNSSNYLDAINDRLMFRLAYRNLGTSESLITNHTVNAATNPSYRAGVRFYQLTRSSPNAAFTIAEQQTWAGLTGDTAHRWMGSGAMNYLGDIAVGYSVSSSTVFPSIRYAAKLHTDPAGSGLAQGEQTIITGSGSQTHTSGRWGDYSDMTIDPADDCSFWYTQEYYSTTSENGWRTRIAKLAPGTVTVSPRGTISGTITKCQSGLPFPNAIVQIAGGYFRMTDASGFFSATVAPGTYIATVTAPGYNNVSSGNLVVSNGGTATFNACLTGIPAPAAGGASVTADGCNSNGAIDPNETVTVSLGIKNTGSADTANLVATLQSTGGVTNPSAPQNYGIVVAGGATVFRSFTFTASNLDCGGTLVATLHLQDGASDLGTVTFNFNVGLLTVALSENFDGVSAPTLPAGWVASNPTGSRAVVGHFDHQSGYGPKCRIYRRSRRGERQDAGFTGYPDYLRGRPGFVPEQLQPRKWL